MKTYESANLRNVAVVGHSHCGKTSLISALLYTAGPILHVLQPGLLEGYRPRTLVEG